MITFSAKVTSSTVTSSEQNISDSNNSNVKIKNVYDKELKVSEYLLNDESINTKLEEYDIKMEYGDFGMIYPRIYFYKNGYERFLNKFNEVIDYVQNN